MSHDHGANPMRWDCAKQGCFNRKKRLAEAVEEARAVIGCLLNLLDENDAVFDLCKSNVVLWNAIEKARDWENKCVALESKP